MNISRLLQSGTLVDMGLGHNIRKLRLARHLTYGQVARAIGTEPQQIHNLETRGSKRSTLAPALARYFGVSLEAIVRDGDDDMNMPAPAGNTVPLISWEAAARLTEILINPTAAEGHLPCPTPHSADTFALRVRDVSMEALPGASRSYRAGDIIFVDPLKDPENGSRVIAQVSDGSEVLFRELTMSGERRFLRTLNPSWPDPMIELNGSAVIVGTVIGRFTPE